MKEKRNLEFKENITNTFLKTVSAYANYDGGMIVFGVDDDGHKTGLTDIKEDCLAIENKINDSIVPQPNYTLKMNEADGTITLEVKAGMQPPYLYKSKAYKRNDTATIEVDQLEFRRLVLKGKNINFEELATDHQDLKFQTLEKKLIEITGITHCTSDVLKTLNLYSDNTGFNHAAEILSDHSSFPGIDLAKFGESISIIQKRAAFQGMSILEAYDHVIEIFKDYYEYEEIKDSKRKTVERIPETSFREAIANAIIHRVWDVNAQIRILMYDDKIEIISPGGLPYGITKDEYLSGMVSILRNPILGNIFYRLKIVEIFGTGITRIIQAYEDSMNKPIFDVKENSIKITLPVLNESLDLSKDELEVYKVLSKTIPKSIGQIMEMVHFGKTKTHKLLKQMVKKNIVAIEGRGRGTKYKVF